MHDSIQYWLYLAALKLRCHQRSDRSFSVRSRQVPVCARCLGLLIGPAFSGLYVCYPHPPLAFGCIIAFLLDSVTQMFGLRESNNWLRLFTGAGFSASALYLIIWGGTVWLWNTKP